MSVILAARFGRAALVRGLILVALLSAIVAALVALSRNLSSRGNAMTAFVAPSSTSNRLQNRCPLLWDGLMFDPV
jgi:hypothetical protein